MLYCDHTHIEAYSSLPRFRVSTTRETTRVPTQPYRLQLPTKAIGPSGHSRRDHRSTISILNLPNLSYALNSAGAAFRTARRPASKCALLIAVLFFACCIARSDAQVEIAAHPSLDTSHIVGTWYSSHPSNYAQHPLDAARTAGAVASAQALLTTPQYDDVSTTPGRVAPLRIDTQIHARRVYESAEPNVRFTPHLAPGQRRMLRAGSNGIAWVTERITYWNDIAVNRQTISHEVVRDAKPGVVRTLVQSRPSVWPFNHLPPSEIGFSAREKLVV